MHFLKQVFAVFIVAKEFRVIYKVDKVVNITRVSLRIADESLNYISDMAGLSIIYIYELLIIIETVLIKKVFFSCLCR